MTGDESIERNKQVVEAFVNDVAIAKRLDRLDDLVAVDYLQHNPHAGQGREGVREYFAGFHRAREKDLDPSGTVEVHLIGEGDLVVRHEIRVNGLHIDIWRVRGGMLQEHWDAWRSAPGYDPPAGS
ncbi:nuclear transport factor 2 family protein [Streptomyces griseoruber]|uniref:SnoaL-like domain-containing protein n=1 Tax=Streptomyces griseoruber TaxID=1943 RepID=A0A101SZZ9_9ACTN|nr:nuclear transport factor 2 family protein [Streptomyces griseoruber]KUN83256.1 hypothetical protein AQJ64_17440 [Streptomyces griseoruber]